MLMKEWIVLLAICFSFVISQGDDEDKDNEDKGDEDKGDEDKGDEDPYAHCECAPITGRAEHYGNIPSRNAMLNGVLTPLTRHHIIPVNVLTNFGNLMVVGTIPDEQRRAADSLIRNMYTHYEGKPLVQLLPVAPKKEIKKLRKAAVVERVSTAIQSFYHWLPGNIFYGPPPNLRSDDPDADFEIGARNILGTSIYDQIKRVYEKMINYIHDPDNRSFAEFDSILTGIIQLFNDRQPHEYDPNDWSVEDGKYYIREKRDELRFMPPHEYGPNDWSVEDGKYYIRSEVLQDHSSEFCMQIELCRDATDQSVDYFNYAVVGM